MQISFLDHLFMHIHFCLNQLTEVYYIQQQEGIQQQDE